jgi:hypothetical protein
MNSDKSKAKDKANKFQKGGNKSKSEKGKMPEELLEHFKSKAKGKKKKNS